MTLGLVQAIGESGGLVVVSRAGGSAEREKEKERKNRGRGGPVGSRTDGRWFHQWPGCPPPSIGYTLVWDGMHS